MSSRQWESFFGVIGFSGGAFDVGSYTDGHSAGYEVNGDHAEGATVVALEGGTGQLLPGTVLYFDGDETAYTVTASVGGAAVTSVTVSPALAADLDDGTAVGDKLAAGPSDQMAYLLAGYLAADPAISLAVGGRIERMGIEPQEDARQLPRIYVYPGSVEQVSIAQIADKDCDVIVVLVFALTNLKPASPGGVTIASILTQIERVAAVNNQMTVQFAPGNEQVLADQVTIAAYQTAALLDEKERPMAFSQSIQFRYKNVCERSTGRIWQLARAVA